MKELEKLILLELLAKLRVQKAKQEFSNTYVFGFDDVERIIQYEISTL